MMKRLRFLTFILIIIISPSPGYVSYIGIAQASQLSPLWGRWEQEGRHCVTDMSGSIIGGDHSIVQIESNGGTGTWNGTQFNLIPDWADITKDSRVRSFLFSGSNPCSEAMGEWSGWFYTCNGCIGWNPGGGQISDVEGWQRLDYPPSATGHGEPGGWWESDFGWPIESQEYMFYIPATPDGRAKVVVQVEPDISWWNSYNPSSGDYQLKGVAAKEGTRLRFELGDMGIGEIYAKLDFTLSADRFATEDVTWDGGSWRWRSEYTYKYLRYYGAYLVNRIANIHSSKIPIYPSLAGEEDSKTEILYPEVWIRPDKVDVQIMNAVSLEHIRWLIGVDPYKVEWDGKNDNVDIVPKGLYSIRVILPQDNTHEYYDSLDGGVSRPAGSANKFEIKAEVSETRGDGIIFKYTGTTTDILNEPKDCWVYMNLYDDEFRLIKRLLEGKENVSMGEARSISWDYRPYSPGTYYWTVWGVDSLGNQAHVRAGKFTVQEHLIQGTREPYPDDEPGWDKEGPIVRVRQPVLVVATDITSAKWAAKITAGKAVDNLKNKMNYRIFGDGVQLVSEISTGDAVHKGLEASDIFYFAGHGATDMISSHDTQKKWFLVPGDIIHDPRLHRWQVLIQYPYKFVFLNNCFTGQNYSDMVDEFMPESFMGWANKVFFPAWWQDLPYSLLGINRKNWTIKLWNALGDGKSLTEAIEIADTGWDTQYVTSPFHLRKYGDANKYLK